MSATPATSPAASVPTISQTKAWTAARGQGRASRAVWSGELLLSNVTWCSRRGCECVQRRCHEDVFPQAQVPDECLVHKDAGIDLWVIGLTLGALGLTILAVGLVMAKKKKIWRERNRREEEANLGDYNEVSQRQTC